MLQPAGLNVHEDAALTAVRRRSTGLLGYLFWVLLAAGALAAANLTASLLERWLGLLAALRPVFGIRPPPDAPDWWMIGGFAFAALVFAALLIWAWLLYRGAWNRRIAQTWQETPAERLALIRPLRIRSDERELSERRQYLTALLATPSWNRIAVLPDYRETAEAVLRELEVDIGRRALAAGLVIGLNRNPLIDSLTILASALELQFHVLTRLGKRPSLKVWVEMLKRTGASLFLNSYVNREDALYLNLAIRKAAWGMELASEGTQHAADALHDVDWDDLLGGHSIPGVSAAASVAAMGLGVGAFGLRQIGRFIETTAEDLLQGVLASGILYYHGMALAADCLALDRGHRESPAMTRTVSEAMAASCAPAGRLLRDSVRRMRDALKERRRLAAGAAKDMAARQAGSAWDSVVAALSFGKGKKEPAS